MESDLLSTQCSILKGHLEIIKRSIANERDKQQVLIKRLSLIRGGHKSASDNLSDFKYPALPSHTSYMTLVSTKEDADSTFSDGSPVSLRTKRKGMVIDEELRAVKRLKTLA